jgi:hypothetical protein
MERWSNGVMECWNAECPTVTPVQLFQGLENRNANFPSIGRSQAEKFQALGKRTGNFPGLGKKSVNSPKAWKEYGRFSCGAPRAIWVLQDPCRLARQVNEFCG